MPKLEEQLANLPPDVRALLEAHAFDAARVIALAADLQTSTSAEERRDTRNRVRGEARAPAPDELLELPAIGSPEHDRLRALGAASIRRGELAFCVMAGGMATRMGGVVKALVEAFDGMTFLDVRLRVAGTPVTNERYCFAPKGNAYGSALTPANVGFGRGPRRSDLDNLWLVNATAGFPSVAGTVGAGMRLFRELS